MPLKPIDLEKFIKKARNVHEAIVAASKRARQINEEQKIEFNQRLELLVPKTDAEAEENEVNPDQLKVSVEFEKRPKPTDVALDELMNGEIEWRYKERLEMPPLLQEEEKAEEEEAEEE